MCAKGTCGGKPRGHAGVPIRATANASGPWRVHVPSRWSKRASVGPGGHRSSLASWETAGRPPADRAHRT
eukprot:14254893-Alexandrium_andersonii.AAC.1